MLVAGLMSGTSADAIDAALVEITGLEWKTRIQLVGFGSVPYPPEVRRKILRIAAGAALPAAEISQLNFLLGELFARACQIVCRRSRVPMDRLRLIGSHGQTIYHQPGATSFCGVPVRSTLQIGDPSVIAARTGVTTVGDFRPADMAAGGQGAPLVPFFDYLLYRHPKIGRVVLNIGGIANLTAIPAHGGPDEIIAFDTGPGNMLLDALASLATEGKLRYDRGGRLAAAGHVDEALLGRLMRLPYFNLRPPKATGREQFGNDFLKKHFMGTHTDLKDSLATATAFTAESIARGIGRFVLPKFRVQECLVSGGGVKNGFLMKQIHKRCVTKTNKASYSCQSIKILSTTKAGLPANAKEAVAFAVLAYHTFHEKPSNLCAATGAKRPAVLGKIAYAGS
ncbi:MAG: anhydro-N-acetylmuramic acid kinase [Acidobacteria bacterium]|nr:anhydro-N-acetylmuramic acid kinase [Acidobacteriota bacterium]